MSEQTDFTPQMQARIGLSFALSFLDAQGTVIKTIQCTGEVQPAHQENGNGNHGS